MAYLSLSAPDAYTVEWSARSLGNPWDNDYYQRIVLSTGTTSDGSLYAPSGIVDSAYPPSNGSSYSTPYRELGASPDSYYYRYCYALAANGRWYYVGEDSVWTPEEADNTDPTLGFAEPTGSAVTTSSIYVYVTGRDNKALNYFRYYLDGSSKYTDYVSGTYDDSDYTFTGLSAGTTYKVEVRVTDTSGNWTSKYWYVTTKDSTPTPSGFTATTVDHDSIKFSWNSVSGADYYGLRIYSPDLGEKIIYGTSYTWDGLAPDTWHYADVRAYDSARTGWGSRSSYGAAKTDKGRPASWSWYASKSSGVDFNITGDEWNDFFSRINAFRAYKGYGAYSYTSAYTGDDFLATQYNEARNAINTMSPSTSIPVYRNRGDDILASDINRLRDSLNSIT